jgi:hypothetical protein
MEQIFPSLDEFIGTVKELGVTKIVFAETNEKRAVQTGENSVEVLQYITVEVLAYKKPMIYKCRFDTGLDAAGLEVLHDRLVSSGFSVTRKSRNIT